MTECEHRFLCHLFNTEISDMDIKYKIGRRKDEFKFHPIVEKWYRDKMRSLSKEDSVLNKMYHLYTSMYDELLEAQYDDVEAYNDLQDENENLKKSLKFSKYILKKLGKKL